jgi:predicted polyphosphate/ATP-dependent NAD kinase
MEKDVAKVVASAVALLGKKIGINIHEGIYANKAQAIAVAYSQVRKRHPSCRRILGKKSRRRSMRRRINDGVQGTGEII